MTRFIDGDYIIIVLGRNTRSPTITIYRNDRAVVHYSERYGHEILAGTCDEISEAMKLVAEYFPRKVVELL